MSDWHDELEFALLPLEDAEIDSDCMTFVISNALSEHGIFHQCRIGYAEDRLSRMATTPHCWIELEQGWCIDLRLRQWLGDEDDLPWRIPAIQLPASSIPRQCVAGSTPGRGRFEGDDK